MSRLRFVGVGIGLIVGSMAPVVLRAAVLDVSGAATAEVSQIRNGSVVQTETVTNSFPVPSSQPVVSNVRIDGLSRVGGITSSSQCSAVADDSRSNPPVIPLANNDLGLDLGGFSTDGETSYIVNGSAQQTRQIQLTRAETTFPATGDGHFRSTFSVAGALVVVATSPNPDLTGLELTVHFEVVQQRAIGAPTTRLTGSGTLTGGPNGQLTFTGDGVINPLFYPVIDILVIAPGLNGQPFSFVKAIAFPANIFNYTYPAAPNELFGLTATFTVQAIIPATTDFGAAAVFGLPEQALGEVVARVRGDDSGVQVESAIGTIVDTSGQTPARFGLPLISACGAVGFESLALTTGAALVGTWRRRRGAGRRA